MPVVENQPLFMVIKLNNDHSEGCREQSAGEATITEVLITESLQNEIVTSETHSSPLLTALEGNSVVDINIYSNDINELLPVGEDQVHVQENQTVFNSVLDGGHDSILNQDEAYPSPIMNNTEASDGLTKKGNPRKRAPRRKKHEINPKRQKNKEKHNIQPPCIKTCKKKCTEKISQNRRDVTHQQFWDMEDQERKMFVLGNVDIKPIARRTTEEESRRGDNPFLQKQK
nr:unnamed protein product [Callosobruchus analis]